jgi:hypothetical protein
MKTKKNIIRLTESELKRVISESVKRNINEINFQKGKNFITESMVAPYTTQRIWVYNDDNTCFLVYGDGDWFHVYPTYGDSYKVDNKCDKYINKVAENVRRAFANKNIRVSVTPLDGGELIIEIRDEYNGEFDEPLKAWLSKKGFTFTEYEEMYHAYRYQYKNYTNEYDENEIQSELNKYTEITDIMRPYIRAYKGTSLFRQLDKFYNEAQNKSKIQYGFDDNGYGSLG